MLETGSLVQWNPLIESVYNRFTKPMYLENIEFDGELKLTFGPADNRYQFLYERSERFFYPIRVHRVLLEHTRYDIEELIEQRVAYLKENSLELPSFDSTFYKIANSSYLKWYTTVDDSIPDFEIAALEHHLYITDDYFIDVLASVQPRIIKVNT